MTNLNLNLLTYKSFKISARMRDDVPEAAVFDPRYPGDPALYKTTSLDEAMRWVDAYRAGAIWADQEALAQSGNRSGDRDTDYASHMDGFTP